MIFVRMLIKAQLYILWPCHVIGFCERAHDCVGRGGRKATLILLYQSVIILLKWSFEELTPSLSYFWVSLPPAPLCEWEAGQYFLPTRFCSS
jgi:hypothetical protein